MNRKEWDAARKKIAHRQIPRDQWDFRHVAREFGLKVPRPGRPPHAHRLFADGRTHAKKTEAGLWHMKKTFGLTPSEAADYIPDFFRDRKPVEKWRGLRGADPRALEDWVQFLEYVMATGLARRGRSDELEACRGELHARVLPKPAW